MKTAHILQFPAKPKRIRVRDYRLWLRRRGIKPLRIERTEKRPGDLEIIGGCAPHRYGEADRG